MTAIRKILIASAATAALLFAFQAVASDASSDRHFKQAQPVRAPAQAGDQVAKGDASARPPAERLVCTCTMK